MIDYVVEVPISLHQSWVYSLFQSPKTTCQGSVCQTPPRLAYPTLARVRLIPEHTSSQAANVGDTRQHTHRSERFKGAPIRAVNPVRK